MSEYSVLNKDSPPSLYAEPSKTSEPHAYMVEKESSRDTREWYKRFNPLESLRDVGEVTFARSSGPGGQNVNKVNSKAQLRVPVGQLLPLLPTALHNPILTSRYYAENTSCLLIQADESRKAQANKDACYRKLNELIVDVFKHTVPGETTDEQKEKVKRLQKAENESRLRWKKLHSSKKQSRSSKGDSD